VTLRSELAATQAVGALLSETAMEIYIVTTGRGRVSHLLIAFHVEVIACLQGMHTALNLSIERLILESDALLVVHALNLVEAYDRPEEGLVNEALFTSKKFCKIGIVALSFVFDKYCSIIN